MTLAQNCYDILQQDIINGRFLPGDNLRIEKLKDYLKVGHTPIREALSRLVSTELVEIEGKKGFRVASTSEEDIRDIYYSFLQIDCLLLKESIKKGDASWEAQIIASLHKLSLIENSQDPDYDSWVINNENFHRSLISGCNSKQLMQIHLSIYKKFDRFCRISFNLKKTKLKANNDDHQDLAKLVITRDVIKSTKLLSAHIIEPLEEVINLFRANKII
jgi:GntR family carbon starvation induced transcriptional regulator